MCGLAGAAGTKMTTTDLKIFRDLLFVSALRGEDATGVLAARSQTKKGSYRVIKHNTDSLNYLGMYGQTWMNDVTYDLMMGHCRWATVGGLSAKNAHPFDYGRLVGAHNGTLKSPEFLVQDKTDSEMLVKKMSDKGIEETLRGLRWDDAYAVTIWDKFTRKLTLARNYHRTLFIGFREDTGTMFWASEERMLQFAADRNKVKMEIFYLTPDHIYTVDIGLIAKGNTGPFTITDIAPKWIKPEQGSMIGPPWDNEFESELRKEQKMWEDYYAD